MLELNLYEVKYIPLIFDLNHNNLESINEITAPIRKFPLVDAYYQEFLSTCIEV